MSDIRKAAVLLMSLPEDQAAPVLAKKKAHAQASRAGDDRNRPARRRISGDEQELVINEFADSKSHFAGWRLRGVPRLRNRSWKKHSARTPATTLKDNVRQQIEALPFGFLQKVDSQNLLTFIIDEHPQTIALILSHFPANTVHKSSPACQDRRLSVIRRVAKMGRTNPEIIREVEKGLERRMASVMSQSFENAGGVPAVAEILNVADRATERRAGNSVQKIPTWSRKSAA